MNKDIKEILQRYLSLEIAEKINAKFSFYIAQLPNIIENHTDTQIEQIDNILESVIHDVTREIEDLFGNNKEKEEEINEIL